MQQAQSEAMRRKRTRRLTDRKGEEYDFDPGTMTETRKMPSPYDVDFIKTLAVGVTEGRFELQLPEIYYRHVEMMRHKLATGKPVNASFQRKIDSLFLSEEALEMIRYRQAMAAAREALGRDAAP